MNDRRPLRVLVGVQDDGMNGIENYAEQTALAACAAGHDTTLLTTNARLAAAVRSRTGHSGLSVVDAGLPPTRPQRVLLERLLPALHTRRTGKALKHAVIGGLHGFDVLHLNRPALAPYGRGAAKRIYCAGWFYPHAVVSRAQETWRHTRGPTARRIMLVGKSIAFYLGDERGYRAVTAVVVGTDTLAAQLRSHGIAALTCPPPARAFTVIDGAPRVDAGPLPRALRLLVCSGDLSHPRKNLVDAVRAAELLAARGVRVEVRAIGRNPALLERVASSISPAVELTVLGPGTPTEVHSEMRHADVLLVPSLYEEWGYVAVESILAGTPVATYPVYPFFDMLSGGIGEIAHAVTVGAFADAIERAASGVRGGALARQGARRFGSTEIGERLTAIWRADVHTARM